VLIAGNWKMFKGPAETREFCAAFRPPDGVDVVLCPPFVSLAAAVEALGKSRVGVYAQNVHWEDEGAFTGEVSAGMLAELGVAGSLVGHSERRQYFGETDDGVAARTARAIESHLAVVACVGETESERESGTTGRVLRRQVDAIGDAVGQHDLLTIAYEPVWAIGTGRTATPETAQEAHALIKSILDVPVLYGGSVKAENADELLAQQDVDGALVGGASLEVASFTAICEAGARVAAKR
jgi:triosephosphate isomerase (TIM)